MKNNTHINLKDYKDASYKQVLSRIFSIHEDAASHEEIRSRLLSGGRCRRGVNCWALCWL